MKNSSLKIHWKVSRGKKNARSSSSRLKIHRSLNLQIYKVSYNFRPHRCGQTKESRAGRARGSDRCDRWNRANSAMWIPSDASMSPFVLIFPGPTIYRGSLAARVWTINRMMGLPSDGETHSGTWRVYP